MEIADCKLPDSQPETSNDKLWCSTSSESWPVGRVGGWVPSDRNRPNADSSVPIGTCDRVDPSAECQHAGDRNCGACLQQPTSALVTRALWPTRIWWHQVVRAIVHNKLAVVLAAVLDGDGPDVGVVGQPVPEKFRCIV
jgi:hypothetical protein